MLQCLSRCELHFVEIVPGSGIDAAVVQDHEHGDDPPQSSPKPLDLVSRLSHIRGLQNMTPFVVLVSRMTKTVDKVWRERRLRSWTFILHDSVSTK
jgi:hypothetical protein